MLLPRAESENSNLIPGGRAKPPFKNPYDFTHIASHEIFKGRQDEIDQLLGNIVSGTHTAVFGLQRMGKTSLVEICNDRSIAETPRTEAHRALFKDRLPTNELFEIPGLVAAFVEGVQYMVGKVLSTIRFELSSDCPEEDIEQIPVSRITRGPSRHPVAVEQSDRRRQTLYRWNPGKPDVDDRGAD